MARKHKTGCPDLPDSLPEVSTQLTYAKVVINAFVYYL